MQVITATGRFSTAQTTVCRKGERVFIVSIRKDVDDHSFRFPPVIPLEMCMGDLLDEEVPAEFYLSEEKTQSVIRHDSNHPGHIADRGGTCPTLLSRDYKDPKVVICS